MPQPRDIFTVPNNPPQDTTFVHTPWIHAAAFLLAVTVASTAHAQIVATTGGSGPRTGTAAVVTKAPLIDGRLDDDVW
jgi:hypothetical protein